MVYAKFGGQTKCIMGNSKIKNEALLLVGFRSGFCSTDHYHGSGPFRYFSLTREIQVERKVFKTWNLLFSSQQYNYSKRNLVLRVHRAPVAQLVEHRAVTREVASSTPDGPTLRVFK